MREDTLIFIDRNISNNYREKEARKSENSSILSYINDYSIAHNLSDISFAELLYLIKHELTTVPVCGCGNHLPFISLKNGYKKFCSDRNCNFRKQHVSKKVSNTLLSKTPDQQETINNKRRQTFNNTYGVDHPSKCPEIKEKTASTNLERYGVTSTLLVPAVQEKIKATNLQKYGTEKASASPVIRQKIAETNLRRYGHRSHLQNRSVRKKINKTMLYRYGNEQPMYCDSIRKKLKDTLVSKYGVANVAQRHILAESLETLNDKIKLNALYELHQSTIVVGEMLEVSRDTVVEYLHFHNIPIRYNNISSMHLEISSFVRSFGVEVLDNDRSYSNTEMDIYIPALKLGFECNGTYWHSELNGKLADYHVGKTDILANYGIELYHIWEHDWYNSKNIIKSRIKAKLGKLMRVYARKCKLKPISNKESNEFLERTHIQGSCHSAYRYGLFYNEELVSVMTFGKSRFNKTYNYELLRFSTELDTVVVGAASKLFSEFKNVMVSGESIISYADRSFSNGKVYITLGFKLSHTTAPAYHYTRNYKFVENRVAYQKHKLPKLLEKFDSSLTEWENMKNNGYDRVWDCGNYAYIWQK